VEKQEFTQRIQKMTERLYKVCYAQLANVRDREDAVQECICKAWQQRYRLRKPAYFETWVIRILLNVCHDIQRANSHIILTDDVLTHENKLPRPHSNPETQELRDALLRLDPKQRLPLVLHHMCGFSTAEVARILHLRPGTVRTRMSRGRIQLRELLGSNREVADAGSGTKIDASADTTETCCDHLV
jgi:RNA polymerase sigma-70 factor (ECF subfamily)